MTSKQGKLAAARKKLKEFQGKYREVEVSKQKNISSAFTTKTPNVNVCASDSGLLFSQYDTLQNYKLNTNSHESFIETPVIETVRKKTSSPLLKVQSENMNSVAHKGVCANGLETDYTKSHNIEGKKSSFYSTSCSERTENILNDTITMKSAEGEEMSENYVNNRNSLHDLIQPLQLELQNHAQTITILVQQRNDAQTALDEAQKLLHKAAGEAEVLKEQITVLTSSQNSLSQKLSDAEDVIMKLKLEKEDSLQKFDELQSLHTKLDTKEEEFQEMKRKFEEKNRNFQQLQFSLHEAQSQLSLYQIQLQQYSAEGHSSLAIQVSQLQNENLALKQKVEELEKKLEMERMEKEESSQKFHIYAQQCNSQLSSLNFQIKSLKLENEMLIQKNDVLSKNVLELENSKGKTVSFESFETEIADLHNQLSALSEKHNNLNDLLKSKDEERTRLEKELEEREFEFNKLEEKVKELEEENQKLATEAETPKANKRLLATMESDKIAAAKAVSQNQKLKEQVTEFEEAFIKLSEEKLELTNQLAHEKHVNTELQNLLKKSEVSHSEEDGHHHYHHACHREEKPEPLVNDSNEIDELRRIVRQLQDDKIQLTARLNSYESKRSSESAQNQKKECEHENHETHEESHCESTKLLLQQMEEKVRKTMNEIAVLDEEKEKLEHLVLQLQGETETIGEYITLYQKQRMILRQRAQQKDIQLMQLSKDKEELKSKLASLDELVQHLIGERENINIQPGSKLPPSTSGVAQENTAGKIRALINEIGSTTLINNHSIAFEHCSCCSGRLITI